MKKFLLLVFCSCTLCEVPAQVLTLDEAINIALKNSLEIEIARDNITASEISNNLSLAGGLPTVRGTLTNTQSVTNLNQKLSNGTTTKRNGNAVNSLNAGIGADFLVFNGFRVKATKSRLAVLETQSRDVLNTQIQNIVADVMVKYFDIVRQYSYITTIQQSIEVTRQQKSITMPGKVWVSQIMPTLTRHS